MMRAVRTSFIHSLLIRERATAVLVAYDTSAEEVTTTCV